jgi:serine/threonine protein phosphatase PrpC
VAKLLRLDVAQLTDVGRKREHNEDNMAYVIPKDPQVMAHKGALFIVADGMGGHAAGEVASEIAVDTISNAYYQDNNDDVALSLLYSIRRANASIHQRAAENMLRSGMGTTCVAIALRGSMAYIANVGDSRAYLIRKSRIRQVSQDHSWVAEQVRAGLLTEEQARTHAQRNVITRSLGTQPDVEIDIFRELLEEGDTLVLCSDGLSGPVNDEELLHTVDQFLPQESVYHLVERANENGGPDNITAVVVRIQEVGTEPPGVRQPVPVGGSELSNEDTARLFAPLGAGVNMSSSRNGEALPAGSPFSYVSGPLTSPESNINLNSARYTNKRRGRLFFPTLVLVSLFILLVAGSGIYYFFHLTQSQTINQTLNNANQLIGQARNNLTTNPAASLQALSSAQRQLQSLQKGYTLSSSSRSRLELLQSQLVSETKTGIMNYNALAKIALLPCTNAPPNTLNNGTNAITAQTVALIRGSDLFTYVLGTDGQIYPLNSTAHQDSLGKAFVPPTANTQFISVIGAGSKIFALGAQMSNNTPAGYTVYMLTVGNKAALQVSQSQAINANLPKSGDVPALVTAWANNLYVVLSSKTSPNTATILSYNVNSKGKLSTPINTSISVSASIIGVAAFPTQLFLLLSDGDILSSPINPNSQSLSNQPTPVLINTPLDPPLGADAQNFTTGSNVPTVTPASSKGSGSLVVPISSAANPATISAGEVSENGAMQDHLFIGDPANHRVLELVILPVGSSSGPGATPTAATNAASGGEVSVTLSLMQQYVSSSYFGAIKSVVTDPNGATVNILSQNQVNIESLLVVSTGPQQACAS